MPLTTKFAWNENNVRKTNTHIYRQIHTHSHNWQRTKYLLIHPYVCSYCYSAHKASIFNLPPLLLIPCFLCCQLHFQQVNSCLCSVSLSKALFVHKSLGAEYSLDSKHSSHSIKLRQYTHTPTRTHTPFPLGNRIHCPGQMISIFFY